MVWLMSLTSNPKTVYRNTIVGSVVTVAGIVETGNKVCVPESEDRCIPGHLKELYSEAIKGQSAINANLTLQVLLQIQHLKTTVERL